MNKYIVNFVIGLVVVSCIAALALLLVHYPLVFSIILAPAAIWGVYQLGSMAKDVWEMSRDRSTRM